MHQIGAGALGPVFRAYEPDQDRLVAVKLFRLDLPPERVHQLVAELEKLIAADLTHPSIAAPVATGISGTSAYLVQDFVAADSLDIVVRDHGPAPAFDALRVATQLGGALDFAATVDVLHGALHPRDVLLSSDDTRVIGHGVTHALERVGVKTAIRRPYTAPERAADGPWDRRADVFSLAALIYEMLSGKRLASSADQAGDTLTAIPGTDAAALRRVFAQALAEDPAKRYATALDFAEALKGTLTIASVEQAPPRSTKAPARAAEPVRRNLGAGALPFEDSHPADSFDIEKVFDGVEEPIDLQLHEEPIVQLRQDEMPELSVAAVPAPVPVAPEARPAAPVPLPIAPLPAETPPKPEWRRRPSIAPAALDAEAPEQVKPALPLAKEPEPASHPSKIAPPTAFIDQSTEEFRESALEKTRSAIWPLALAIGVGLVVGFAGGYGVGMRDRLMPPAATLDSAAPAAVASASSPGVASAPLVPAPAPAAAPAVPSAPAPASAQTPSPAPPGAAAAPSAASAPAATRGDARRRDADPEPAAAVPANGRLVVRSTPPGARVVVDGHDAGTTPATVRELTRGPHSVRVTQDGYVADERRVVLSEDRMSQAMRFELARKPVPGAPPAVPAGPGGLMIESRPTGASVFIDGKLVGTTPMAIESVPAGDHSIGLASDGYQRWVGSVRVETGERARVTASLER